MSEKKFYFVVVSKKTKKVLKTDVVSSKYDFKEKIKKISTTDLKLKNYEFQINATSLTWFGELYKRDFFTIDNEKNAIILNQLPNGIRRTRVYKKQMNYEKTFEGAWARIKDSVEVDLGGLDFGVEAKVTHFDKTVEIKIRLEDYREYEPIKRGEQEYMCTIFFDKIKWKYLFTYIHVKRDLETVQKIIKAAFEKHTSSTRNYRAHHANNS